MDFNISNPSLDVYSDINDSDRFEPFSRMLRGLQSDYGNPNTPLFRIQVTNNGDELRVLTLGPLQEQQQASAATTIGASITQGRPTVDGSDIMTIARVLTYPPSVSLEDPFMSLLNPSPC
jgi:hypothetical protein